MPIAAIEALEGYELHWTSSRKPPAGAVQRTRSPTATPVRTALGVGITVKRTPRTDDGA
jgi:hypothetical protein